MKLVPGAFKRAFLRVVRFTIRHPVEQLAHPLHVELSEVEARVQELDARVQELDGQQHELEQRHRGTLAAIAGLELTADDVLRRADGADASLHELTSAISALREELAAGRSDLRTQRARLELVLREARRALPEPIPAESLATLSRELDEVLGEQYEDFENVFRGSREVVLERQRVYLDDVLALKDQSLPVVDVGCGRGEWLELLREAEIPAYGVDTNPRSVEACRERGLDGRLGDALAHLDELPESSVAAVTAFHFVEHLPFDALVRFVDGVVRALRPGGLFIAETPNPDNVLVGASRFHIDPTHTKPLHSLWLEFLLTARGFVEVELRYLHPAHEAQEAVPADGASARALRRFVEQTNAALFGPQDYAALARTSGPASD
jgi:SAM-dependent methyltransferase